MAEEKEFDKGTPITWDEIDFSGKYVKFESDEEVELKIVDFGWFQREGKKYKSEELEMQDWFDAKVLEVNGKPVDKILSLNSKPFNRATKVLKELDPSKPVYISVLKLGDKSSTAYSIKLVEKD